MKRNNDGYVMVYVIIVMLILLAVSGAVFAAAEHNMTTEMITLANEKSRYNAEGRLNERIAKLYSEASKEATYSFSYEADGDGNLYIPSEGWASVREVKQAYAETAFQAAFGMTELDQASTIDSLEEGQYYVTYDNNTAQVISILKEDMRDGAIVAQIHAYFYYSGPETRMEGEKTIRTYKMLGVNCTYDSFEIKAS